jgi:hypothetical protein
MPENVEQQLASLLQLSKPTLVEAWQQLFKKGPSSQLRRSFMIPILAHKIQEQVSGSLRPEIHRRLQQLLRSLNAADLPPPSRRYYRPKLVGIRRSADASDMICLTVEMHRKRYGSEVYLVVPSSSAGTIQHPRRALIKAVARGHAWYEKILEGERRRHQIAGPRDWGSRHTMSGTSLRARSLRRISLRQSWKDVSRLL